MRSVFVTCLALSSIAFIGGGCANQKAETDRVTAEKNMLQGQYETEKAANAANQAKITELDKQLTALKTELDAAKSALTTAQTESAAKIKEAQGNAEKSIAAAKAQAASAVKAVEVQLKEAIEKAAKAAQDLASAKTTGESQGRTLAEKIATLEKQVADLTKANETLKAAAKATSTSPAN